MLTSASLFDVIAILILALAQITKPPEFEENGKFQTGNAAGSVDGSSHVSAERAVVNQELLSLLRKRPEYAEGVRLIERQLPGAAQAEFDRKQLKAGVAVSLFLAGKVDESAALLCSLAKAKRVPPELLPILGETVGASKTWANRMLAAVRLLSQPDSAESEYYLARALLKQEPAQTAEAMAHLQKSAALDPKSTRALLESARQNTAASQRPSAIALLEEALRRDAQLSVAHYRLAQLYRATGQVEKSREHLRRFEELRIQP